MSRTGSATLPSLPVEIIHRIFDNLDGKTVLLSVRNVCQRLRATVETYNRYEQDLTTLSKHEFHHLLVIIDPKHVNGLILDDRGTTPEQIAVFHSLTGIGLFTELRSLTLLESAREDMCVFLEHVRRCSLTSLTLDSACWSTSDQQRIAEHLSSIIGRPTFLRLRLLSRDLYELLEWPVQCKLQHLRMASCTKRQLSEVLRRVSDLRTLDLGTTWNSILDRWSDAREMSLTSHSWLASLTITSNLDSIETILSFFSFTPARRHLKIINTEMNRQEESR